MPNKALGTDIYHLWACKVLRLGVFHLLLSQLSSMISQASADSKVNTTRKGARGQYVYQSSQKTLSLVNSGVPSMNTALK